ncbi:MAG: hypothetical protein U1D69_04345 [Polynucleobacter sp.]|nr:hypothetical protein [Polynucleobacter sp.]
MLRQKLGINIRYVYLNLKKYLNDHEPTREEAVEELIWAALAAFEELKQLNFRELMALKSPKQEFKRAFNRHLYASLTQQQEGFVDTEEYKDGETWSETQALRYEDKHMRSRETWLLLQATFEAALTELNQRKSHRALDACRAIEAILARDCLDDDEVRKRFGSEVWRTIRQSVEKTTPKLAIG